MENNTVLGLKLSGVPEGDSGISPLSAFVVMKGMDEDGDTVYGVYMTEMMDFMEGAALVRYGDMYITRIINDIFDTSQSQQAPGEASS
jgi:hypothetical protein